MQTTDLIRRVAYTNGELHEAQTSGVASNMNVIKSEELGVQAKSSERVAQELEQRDAQQALQNSYLAQPCTSQ